MDKIYEYLLNLIQMQHYKFWIEVLILIAVLRPEAYKDAVKFINFLLSNLKGVNIKSFLRITFKGRTNDVRDAMAFDAELDKDRITFNATNVNYAVYHNGVAANFRNFSIRNESVRSFKYSLIGMSQQQSLSPFYKLIKMWEVAPVTIVKIDDENNDYDALVRFNLKSMGCTTLIIVPIAIPIKQVYPRTKISLQLNINNEVCAILGCYSIVLDNESKVVSDEELKAYFSAKIDVLRDYYIRTPNAILK